MPELPEVEVVKRSLDSKIQKLVVERITVKDEKLRYRINKKKLKILLGLKIIKILRRSKFLLFVFEKNIVMLVHLGIILPTACLKDRNYWHVGISKHYSRKILNILTLRSISNILLNLHIFLTPVKFRNVQVSLQKMFFINGNSGITPYLRIAYTIQL